MSGAVFQPFQPFRMLEFMQSWGIEEVAQCLENELRIYELLRVGRGEVRQYGAAIVRGTPRGLLWVTGKDFAIWIGPYASQYRFPSSYRVPEHEDFIISAFNTECTEQYEADLRQFGLTVANVHEEMHQVLVKGTLQQVIAASELPWVKHIELLPEIGDL